MRQTFWQTFSGAPHRLMFFAGMLQLVLLLLPWSMELANRSGLTAALPATAVPMWQLHPLLLIYTLYPFFFFGFLMTTFPAWLDRPGLERAQYLPTFLLMASAVLPLHIGIYSGKLWLIFAFALLLAGWAAGLIRLIHVLGASDRAKRHHASYAAAALILGWIGMGLGALWLTTENWLLYRLSLGIGIWLFLIPIYLTVCHRMIPFFSSRVVDDYVVVRPRWTLPSVVACGAAHVAISLSDAAPLVLLPDTVLAFIAWHHLRAWRMADCLGAGNRLLSMLHIAFAWFGIAMLLFALQGGNELFGGVGLIGRAPVHALTIGFFSVMVVAMITRVTLGHSGRPLTCDGYTWTCFLGLNLAAMLRIAAEFPSLSALHHGLNFASACVWLICTSLWIAHYVPMLLRPRTDAMPG